MTKIINGVERGGLILSEVDFLNKIIAESFVNKESMCNFAPQFDYRKILITTYLIIKNNDCSTSKRRRKH